MRIKPFPFYETNIPLKVRVAACSFAFRAQAPEGVNMGRSSAIPALLCLLFAGQTLADSSLPVVDPTTTGHAEAGPLSVDVLLSVTDLANSIHSGADGLHVDFSHVTQLLDGTPLDPATLYGVASFGPWPFEAKHTSYDRKRPRFTSHIRAGRAVLPVQKFLDTLYNTEDWNEAGTVSIRYELYEVRNGPDRFLGIFDTFAAFRKTKTGIQHETTLLEGPLVHMLDSRTPETLKISLRTSDAARPSIVLDDGRRFQSPKTGTRHLITVRGLQPGSATGYRVELGDQLSPRRRLIAASRIGSPTMTFAYAGDARAGHGGGDTNVMGVNHGSLDDLLVQAHQAEAEVMIFGGDIINGYTSSPADFRAQIHSFKQAAAGLWSERPLVTALGNHEALYRAFKTAEGKHIYLDRWPYLSESTEAIFADELVQPTNGPTPSDPRRPTYSENVFSWHQGPVKFIAFNNNYWMARGSRSHGGCPEGYLLEDQLRWILSEVASGEADPDTRFIILFAQEPLFPNGGHIHDTMWYRGDNRVRAYATAVGGGALEELGPGILEVRDRLLRGLGRSQKVAAVLGSDEHAYHRMLVSRDVPIGDLRKDDPDGDQQICQSGETCSPLKDLGLPFWSIVSGGAGAPYYDEQPTPWNAYWRARGEGDIGSAYYVHTAQQHICIFRVDGDTLTLDVHDRHGTVLDHVDDLMSIKR